MPALTPKQQLFVENYLLDLNATQAAIRAGYSARTANQQGPRLLEHPDVIAAIDARKVKRSAELEIDAAWVLRRLAAEAEADLADIYDVSGALLPVESWPPIWRQGLVSGIDAEEIEQDGVKVGVIRKVRLSDRLRRLELIGKHVSVNAFQEQVAVTALDGMADRLERAKQRSKLFDRPVVVLDAEECIAPAAEPLPAPGRTADPPDEAKPSKPPAPVVAVYRPIIPIIESAPWTASYGTADADYDITET